MKSTIKKLAVVAITLSMSLAIVACGSNDDKPAENPKENNEQTETPSQGKEPETLEDYEKDIKEEKEVEDAQVYIKDDSVVATLIIKEDVKDEEAKALGEKYSKDLKAKHADKRISLQVLRGVENVVVIELD